MHSKILSGSSVIKFGIIVIILSMCSYVHAGIIDEENIEVLYLFDEGEGEVAVDSSPNGRDGAIIGAQYTEGVFGTAFQYDGVDDNLIVTGYTGIGGVDPRSILFWFKSNETRQHSWVKWGRNAAGEKHYVRAHPSGEQCFLRIEVNGGQNYGNTDVCDGEWHHCVLVFPDDADSVQDFHLYVDGILQEKIGNDRDMNTDGATQEINVGARLTGHHFLYGLMDELAIFSVAIDEKQVNAIMEDGLHATVSVDPQGKLATSWARIKKY